MKKREKRKIIKLILCFLFLVLFYFSVFINDRFDDITFEQLIYNITNTEGANYSVVGVGAIYIAIRVLATILIFYIIYKLFELLNIRLYFNIGFNNKTQYILENNLFMSARG